MRFGSCSLLLTVAFAAQSVLAQILGQNGQYATSVSLSRGNMPQTFWVKDFLPTASIQSFSVTATYNTTNGLGETVSRTLIPYESMETYSEKGKVTGFYVLLTADDWKSVPEVKTTLTFTCTVRGRYDSDNAYNNMFVLGRAAGRDKYPEKITEGSSPDNPYWIAPQTTARFAGCDSSDRYFSGAFYLSADLKAEHEYMFGIADAGYPVTMRLEGAGDDLLSTAKPYTNANEWADCGSNAWAVVPPVEGTYLFEVKSGSGKFRFKYAMTPDRMPAKHEHGEISTSYPVTDAIPGYLVNPTSGFYDGVIDERLFRFSDYAADGCYVFRTQGADTNLLMRLYDSSGNVLAENRGIGAGDCNVQIAWCASDRRPVPSGCGCDGDCSGGASGDIYVGVCQILAEGEKPSAGPVTLSVMRVEPVAERIPLTVVPDAKNRSPYDAMTNEFPAVTNFPPRELTATNWSQTYVVQARAGMTYRAKARVEDGGSSNGLALAVRAYTLSGSAKKDLPAHLVVASERFDPSRDGWMEFTADSNSAIYLEVSVADGDWGFGRGLAYGPYSVCATAAVDEDSEYGVLKADMFGAADADMGWKILSGPAAAGIRTGSESYYPAGGSVIVPPGGPYVIAAKSITGFQRPDSKGYASVYVKKDDLVDAPRYEYYDTFDPKDDAPGKATKISPSAGKPLVNSRSLWSQDPADWFLVTAKEGAFYLFSLPWENEGGDARVRVYGPDQAETECAYNVYTNPAKAVRIVAAKGRYYVKVSHASAGSPIDTAYTLETLMMQPGTLKLSKNVLNVKESAGYANVVINRTGKDGRIRVKYRTEPITAVPGEDYYSQEGEFVWENGDKSSRTVRVKLIPRMVTEKRGEVRSLKVVFWTVGWDEVDPENEYIPAFDSKMGDTAIVTVAEEGKVRSGKIQVAGCRTPKSPAFEVRAPGGAGTTNLVVRFERVDGSFGAVGVHVEPANGTAVNGVDYSFAGADLVWQDGERAAKDVTVGILRSVDDVAAKSFKLKLTGSAALAASAVSVSIRNDRFELAADEFSKALPKTSGYMVSESRKGTWFVRPDGSWYGSGALTFKLTGPCLFRYAVDGNPPVEVRVAAGESSTVVIPACDNLTYEYLFYDGQATELVQGVRTDAQVAEATVDAVRVASGGKLPDGLKLVRDGSNGTWRVRGVPTKAGNFHAQLQDGAKAVIGEVAYTVLPIRSAAGSFFGLARTSVAREDHPGFASHQRLAQVTLTATDKGRLSAKAVIAGKSYSFSSDGFSAWMSAADGSRVLIADLLQVQKVSLGGQKVDVANRLRCTVVDAELDDSAAWYGKGAVLTLEMAALPDAQGSGYQEHVGYTGELVRDNSKVKAWQTEASGYSAYYTVAFAPSVSNPSPDEKGDNWPQGNGYVTLTVDAKGKVKYSGALPDGTKYSGASVAALGTVGGVPAVRLPLFFSKGSGVFGGWVAVRFPEGRVPSGNIAEADAGLRPTVVPDGSDGIVWSTDDTTLTYKGQFGFELAYDAVGGWYDTVVNLQRYYLDMSVDQFFVDTASGVDLKYLEKLLPADYYFVADASANGQPVDLSVNNLLVDKQVLEKDSTKSYYDWPLCVNPANVTLTFKRATGVFSGTCDLWYEGVDGAGRIVQDRYSKCKHAGVLLMTRGACASLPGDVVASGAVVIPQTIWLSSGSKYTWKSSHRFNICAPAMPH